MKHLIEKIKDSYVEKHLKPSFYFKSDDFFNILTDTEQQKDIHATYKEENGKRCVFFFKGNIELGYLRLKKNVNNVFAL